LTNILGLLKWYWCYLEAARPTNSTTAVSLKPQGGEEAAFFIYFLNS